MYINIETTYQILLSNSNLFFQILKKIDENKNNISENIIKKYELEKIFDNYINLLDVNDKDYTKTLNVINIEHLISHNFFFIQIINNNEYISITTHLLEIFKNIYKDFLKPLRKSDFNENTILMKKYADFFIFNKNLNYLSNEIKEEINGLKNLLFKIEISLNNSIKILQYQKDHLKENNKDYTKIDKLNYIKKIRLNNIQPFYNFINYKTSLFMKNLYKLKEFFSDKPKFYYLKRNLDFYYKLFLLFFKEIRPIRLYITKYIEQKEEEIYLNIGIEKRLNILYDIVESNSNGKLRKIWKLNNIKDIKILFNNISSKKDKNIKRSKITIDKINFFEDYIKESKKENAHKFQKYKILNKYLLESKQSRQKTEKRKEQEKLLIQKFNSFIENNKNEVYNKEVDITLLVKSFLDKKLSNWEVGNLQYLLIYFIKKFKKDYCLKYIKEEAIEINKQRLIYKSFYLARKNK